MIRILLVEDDVDLNRFVASSLRGGGYDVTACFDGVEALEAMEGARFDLLLTDVMMPRMNGFELAESVRLTDNSMPIVFMTARDDKSSKMLGYNVGIDEYVTKPFDIDVLMMSIKAILRRAKIEAERREISDIRKQYAPQNEEESKLQRLRRLDNAVRGTAAAWALAMGIVGCLIFGLGLSMILEWNIVAWGVVLCVLGAVPTSLAYPVYKRILAGRKDKYAKQVFELSDALLNE